MKMSIALLAVIFVFLQATANAESWMDKAKAAASEAVKNSSNSGGSNLSSALSTDEISAGLKDALSVGVSDVVAQLGQPGGFNQDPAIHIPLPGQLETVKKWLDKAGMGDAFDDLDTRLNDAAEVATPEAKELFLNAISEMSIDDARKIYSGPDDSATQYFREKMSGPLAKKMRPIVAASLNEVGAVQQYDEIMSEYENIPFVPDAKANLTQYTVDKGMDGIFYYLAKEEAAIRQDPMKQTTEILKKVFGQ
ncbi:Uncharacterised protein [Halioglobus japonicus]|nr:Uncharacterised protein [Halioglobus japonicus]